MSQETTFKFCWTVIASGKTGPGPRSRHCFAYDFDNSTTILFGGIIWDEDSSLCSDTWELRRGRWSQVESHKLPPARHRGAMVYNKACQYSVMFGGQGHTNEMLRDTWIYADGQWREWQKRWWKRRPPARCGHSLTYDANMAKVVLFGGIDPNDQPLGDTWLFDGDSWRAVTGPAPPARRYAAFAYDPDLKGCVLHGGAEDDQGQRYFGDAWLFRAGTWQPLGQLFETNGRDDHGLAFHFAAHRLVMLGGLTGGQEIVVLEDSGWQKAIVHPLHPRHQCSPLIWNDSLQGLVRHGGEVCHGGPQFDHTEVLRCVIS